MKHFLFILLIYFNLTSILAQKQKADSVSNLPGSRYFRIMFYNAENFFDATDDSLTNDKDFLPEGAMHWTNYRFYQKRNNLAKIITAIGEWQAPDIIGLCEIENRYCLENLCNYSPIKKLDYKIIHKESQDARGIDVGLLYRSETFETISYEAITIHFPLEP